MTEGKMTNEFPPDDRLKDVWQNQKPEGISMSTQEIRRKVEKFERRVFWENVFNYSLGLVGVAFVTFFFLWHGYPKDALIRLGLGLTVAAVLYILWQNHKRSPFRLVPAEIGSVSCLDFYRRELERRRDHRRRFWRDIGTAVPGVVILWVAMARIRPSHVQHPGWVLMGIVAVSALIVLYFWRQSASDASKLQRQIDELDAMQKQQ